MNSTQQQFSDLSSERFARIAATFEAELRQRRPDRESEAVASDVIEEPCRLAPTVLRRRRTQQ